VLTDGRANGAVEPTRGRDYRGRRAGVSGGLECARLGRGDAHLFGRVRHARPVSVEPLGDGVEGRE